MTARLEWVDENEEAILAAGRDFKGPKDFDFWAGVDDPFQFLAACHEWYKYETRVRPTRAGLPIAIDATQSGIQHYRCCQLEPHDGHWSTSCEGPDATPNDLYTACLDVAKQLLEERTRREAVGTADPVNDNERQEIEEYEANMATMTIDGGYTEGAK